MAFSSWGKYFDTISIISFGSSLAGLGTSGMIFFITPTCQFLLGIFYYDEYFDFNKLIGFVIIWVAVAIYLHDLTKDKEAKLV